jgi:hypothetical protein
MLPPRHERESVGAQLRRTYPKGVVLKGFQRRQFALALSPKVNHRRSDHRGVALRRVRSSAGLTMRVGDRLRLRRTALPQEDGQPNDRRDGDEFTLPILH